MMQQKSSLLFLSFCTIDYMIYILNVDVDEFGIIFCFRCCCVVDWFVLFLCVVKTQNV